MTRTRQPQAVKQEGPTPEWEPYTSHGAILRVRHTSCCGRYELASEGGEFFVLRPADRRGHEQTSRGRAYRDVIQMYAALVRKHHLDHTSRGEWYEADPYVNQAEAG
ncbi:MULTISPECIES: hypothetical protein [Streptosporangium]|uniref:Uncharacterized protein n=2 Tax=Streptosporangium TaxID=2000 RepID=A0A1I4EXW3_9ACTN|nr:MULTISPECIES: hypothetical protein [Streptosporangium]MDP9848115.1 hypothetical protein [Streptosporangium lutulentum]SFL08981.1 hypothetical protein SAMN05216275_15310 [Streptosporangium canum]